jgi:hypothetical protein
MDIIILPSRAEAVRPTGLFSTEGLLRLTELLVWLTERQVNVNLYFIMAGGTDELVSPLIEIARAIKPTVPGTSHLLLGAEQVTEKRLAMLVAGGIESLIISAESSGAHDAEAQQALAKHFEIRPASALAITVWLDSSDGGRDLARARAFRRAGVASEKISSSLLPLREYSKSDTPEYTAVPGELLSESTMCDLYANTLTIDADGEIRACTRFARGGMIGNLMQLSPEALIIRKGQMFTPIISSGKCSSCAVRGRFLWPETKSFEVMQLFHIGMARGSEETDEGDQRLTSRALAVRDNEGQRKVFAES